MTNYRDGQRHQIGPISLRYTGLTQWGPVGIATIAAREGVDYGLDWLIAENVAHIIALSKHLWTAKENSMAIQRATGVKRGNLRIDLTNGSTKLGDFSMYADKHFFLARLVTGARPGERAVRPHRTTDYRREAFRVEKGRSQQDSRREFIELAGLLARSHHPNLPADWEAEAMNRFWLADAAYQEIATQRRESEAEDNPSTIVPPAEGEAA